MSHAHTRNHLHIIFGTKGRRATGLGGQNPARRAAFV